MSGQRTRQLGRRAHCAGRATLLGALVLAFTAVPLGVIGPVIRSLRLHQGESSSKTSRLKRHDFSIRRAAGVGEHRGVTVDLEPSHNEAAGQETATVGAVTAAGPSKEADSGDKSRMETGNEHGGTEGEGAGGQGAVEAPQCWDLRERLSRIDAEHAPPLLPREIDCRWVYNNNDAPGVNYSHMAMIERLPSGLPQKFIAVWQAASRLAGLPDQHIRGAVSEDLVNWSPSWRLDLPQNGSLWAPVLMLHPRGAPLHLFYAESRGCTRTLPNLDEKVYAPGGDIKMSVSSDGRQWGPASTLLSEEAEGYIPKVIANRPVITTTGHWVLPMWREDPGPADCRVGKSDQLSGGMLSGDDGKTWFVGGDVGSARLLGQTRLLEGAVVALGGDKVLQVFRSTTGNIWRSISGDGGRMWGKPEPTTLPNPNSKIHAIRMSTGLIALGYNHHAKLEDEWGGTRTALWVAVSPDEGATWVTAARLEDGAVPRYKFHYPTLLELDSCRLAVVYTVGRKEHASAGGVKLAVIDLSKWAAKFGSVAPSEEDPPWTASMSHGEVQPHHSRRKTGGDTGGGGKRSGWPSPHGRSGTPNGGARRAGESNGRVRHIIALGSLAGGGGSPQAGRGGNGAKRHKP